MADAAIIRHILGFLFNGERVALDHNPALILRDFNPRTGKYNPDANDPDHLIYRVVDDHHRKTNVAGDGALRSDTAERVHRRRLDKNRDAREAIRAGQPKRRARIDRTKIPFKFGGKSKFPKGRKLQSRNTFKDNRNG